MGDPLWDSARSERLHRVDVGQKEQTPVCNANCIELKHDVVKPIC